MNTDLCATKPKILRKLARISPRSPGSVPRNGTGSTSDTQGTLEACAHRDGTSAFSAALHAATQRSERFGSHGARAGRVLLCGSSRLGVLAVKRNQPLSLTRDFTHEAQEVIFRVTEEGHPEIVIGHFRDQVRLPLKMDISFDERLIGLLYVVHLEVEDGTGMVTFSFLGDREHQASARAVEESHLGNSKQMLYPETVTVKFDCPVQVVDVHGDLPDLRETKISPTRHGHCPFMRKVSRAGLQSIATKDSHAQNSLRFFA